MSPKHPIVSQVSKIHLLNRNIKIRYKEPEIFVINEPWITLGLVSPESHVLIHRSQEWR
jgi:hypothetical protein